MNDGQHCANDHTIALAKKLNTHNLISRVNRAVAKKLVPLL